MSARTVVGTISMFLFCNQFLEINRMPFDYHLHSDESSSPIDLKKGTRILTTKYFQHVLNKYDCPKQGDLVVFERPDCTTKLCIVQAIPRTYFWQPDLSAQYYVPNGFVVLRDPITNQSKMECLGSVRGNRHYVLPF